jgi:hypothetical protein
MRRRAGSGRGAARLAADGTSLEAMAVVMVKSVRSMFPIVLDLGTKDNFIFECSE